MQLGLEASQIRVVLFLFFNGFVAYLSPIHTTNPHATKLAQLIPHIYMTLLVQTMSCSFCVS